MIGILGQTKPREYWYRVVTRRAVGAVRVDGRGFVIDAAPIFRRHFMGKSLVEIRFLYGSIIESVEPFKND